MGFIGEVIKMVNIVFGGFFSLCVVVSGLFLWFVFSVFDFLGLVVLVEFFRRKMKFLFR